MPDRAVLTTGANSGIGLATALEVARRGMTSVGTVRSAQKAEVVHRAAAEAGVEVQTVILDVNDAPACEEVVARRPLYALVNNAGLSLTGAVEDVGDDEARHLFETMVIAPMRLARLVLPAMRSAGEGRIVNVSSIAGLATAPFVGYYTAAKHALEALSDALRMELASADVKVVLVEPGGIRTEIWGRVDDDLARRAEAGSRHASAYRSWIRRQSLRGALMNEPELCARAIVGAITARNPRARYLVGLDARVMRLADSVTPTCVKDRVLRLSLGL